MRRTYERLWTLDSKFVTVRRDLNQNPNDHVLICWAERESSGSKIISSLISSTRYHQTAIFTSPCSWFYTNFQQGILPYMWVIQTSCHRKHSIVPQQSIKFSYLFIINIEKCSDSPASSPSYHAWAHSCPRQLLAPAHPLVWWLLRACQDLYHSARSQRTLTAWL